MTRLRQYNFCIHSSHNKDTCFDAATMLKSKYCFECGPKPKKSPIETCLMIIPRCSKTWHVWRFRCCICQRSCKDPLVETNPQPSNRIPSGDKPAPRSTGQFVDKTTAFRFGEHRAVWKNQFWGEKKTRVCFYKKSSGWKLEGWFFVLWHNRKHHGIRRSLQ